MGMERRGRVVRDLFIRSTGASPGRNGDGELKGPGKPFDISKLAVMGGFEKVGANKGAPGVDAVHRGVREGSQGKPVQDLESDVLGYYFPPPVRLWRYRKPGAVSRILGVPTVGDRVAQTVVAVVLEAKVEPIFHPDSYGYRPGRSAIDAVGACRERCWRADWVIDLDIRAFFDSVPWDLMIKAVGPHTIRPVGAAVCQRWLSRPAASCPTGHCGSGPGDPAGFRGFACAGEPVHALRVRAWMAGSFPPVAVRTVRG